MKGKVIGLLLVLFVVFVPAVKAENNTANKCDYKEKAEKRKLAANVKVAYDIKQRDDGTYYIEIFIYNIVDDLYVQYHSKANTVVSSNTYVFSRDTDANGVYSFIDEDVSTIKTYNFSVHSKGNCSDELKSLTLTKPKYNSLSDMEDCKYFDVEEYMYCQKWITRDFGTDRATIVKRINKQRIDSINMKTTECLSCKLNEDSNAQYERLLLYKKIVIIALAIGILVDIVVIFILRNRIREARFI